MAQQLIESFSAVEAGEVRGHLPGRADEVIKAKRKGKEVHVAAEVGGRGTGRPDGSSPRQPRVGQGRPAAAPPDCPSNGQRSDDLEELTKSELEDRARKAKVEGRSKMSKDELIDALRAA